MRKLIAAIDLGTSKISCAVGEQTPNGVKILGFRSVTPSKGILRGEVINIQQVINCTSPLIQEIVHSVSHKIHGVFLGISGQNIRCEVKSHHITRTSADDLITEDEINQMTAMMYRAQVKSGERILHIVPQSFNIDDFIGITEPAGMSGKEISANFNLIIGKSGSVQNLTEVAKRSGGLSVMDISLNSLASAKSALNDDYREIGVALVDIGAGTTDLTIIEQNIVRYSAVIPFGGNAITNDIKMEFNIASRQAEEIKKVHGSAYSPYTQANKAVAIPGIDVSETKEISIRQLSRVIEARVQEIFEAVDWHLEQSGYKDMLNAGIIITGGTSKLMHICHCAKLVTGLEAHTSNPHNSVTEDSVGDIGSPESSTLIGLILNGFEHMENTGENYEKVTTAMKEKPTLFDIEEDVQAAQERAEDQETTPEKASGGAEAANEKSAEEAEQQPKEKKKSFISSAFKSIKDAFKTDKMFDNEV